MNTNISKIELLRNKVSQSAKIIELIPDIKIEDCKKYIWERLSSIGIYENDENSYDLLINFCKEEDVKSVFNELPIVRFRQIWNIFTENKQEKNSNVESIIKAIPIGQLSDKELLEVYSPDCDSSIVDELSKRSHERAFVIFLENGLVDIETSLRMLREARRRETPVNYKVGDALKRLYKAGEFPGLFYIHCPIHNDILLVDGYCDKSKLSWENVDYECMQFAKLALEIGDIDLSIPNIRQFISIARGEGLIGLRRDFQHTALIFDEKKELNVLPNLKIRFSDKTNVVDDPFGKRIF